VHVIQHFKIKRRRGIIYPISNTTATSAGPVKTWKHPSAHQHPPLGQVTLCCMASLGTEADLFYFVLFLYHLNIFWL